MRNAIVKSTFTRNARLERGTFAVIAALLVAATLSACGNRMDTEPVVPAAIVITTPNASTSVTGTIQFSATVQDANGNTINSTPTWTVVHGGGTITTSGLFTAGDSVGTFENTVVATSGSVSSSSTVVVTAAGLASITVTPDTASLETGGTRQYVAVGKDTHGNVVDIPNRVWSVTHGGGAIDTAGLFTADTVSGSYTNTITATSGSISGSASVTVLPGAIERVVVTPPSTSLAIGAQQTYAATAYDTYNNVVPATPTWFVVGGGGTIDQSGVFTAGTVSGTFTNTVRARIGSGCGAPTASATVVVVPASLATITVTPSSPSLATGATQEFTAVGKDAHDNVVAITPTWSVVNGGGTINSGSGVFTAGSTAGSYANTVKATSGAISGTASVTVTAGALASIAISPTSTTLAPNGTQQFTVTGKDADNNVVPVTPSWSVVAGGGTISNSGLFTAGTTAGTYTNTVVATSGTLAAVATVTVSAGALSSITVTPANPSVMTGATQQYAATGADAYGNAVAITPTWSVNGAAGTINSGGLFTAGSTAGSYTNAIQATSGAISGMASVTVTPAIGPLVRIDVTPANSTFNSASRETLQFIATGYDASDNVVPITPTWSADPSSGTIDPESGIWTVNPHADGPYTNAISATVGTIVGRTSITVDCGC